MTTPTTHSPNLCQVRFTEGSTLYSYYCNGLSPSAGDWVVAPVGAKHELKILRVVTVSDEPWRGGFALKEIWGIVTLRPGETEKPNTGVL